MVEEYAVIGGKCPDGSITGNCRGSLWGKLL